MCLGDIGGGHYRMFSSILDLSLLGPGSTPSCDHLKCLRTLTNVPWGSNSPPVENHSSMGMRDCREISSGWETGSLLGNGQDDASCFPLSLLLVHLSIVPEAKAAPTIQLLGGGTASVGGQNRCQRPLKSAGTSEYPHGWNSS